MVTRPASILVVDDNDLNREMLSRRLQRKGYSVITAGDGIKALELVGNQRFDLLLLDILMPGISGIELLKRVRQVHAPTELPVIMVTAVDASTQVVEALNLGANDYVTKPVDFPVVLARVQTQLSLKQSVDRILQLERNLHQQNEELGQTNEWLEAVNAELAEAYQRMKTDLQLAAEVQKSLLPQSFPALPRARFAWHSRPCSDLAGDLLNIVRLDEHHLGLYVLDVAGHGAAAALLAMMVTRVLGRLLPPMDKRPAGAAKAPPLTPAELARELAIEFPGTPQTDQYFTIVYGLLNLDNLGFRFISAGHPRPICVARSGEVRVLDADGLPIGWGQTDYPETAVQLQDGDRLLLYSDGLTESVDKDRDLFGEERVKEVLLHYNGRPLADTLKNLCKSVEAWYGSAGPRDDISILLCEVGTARPLEFSSGAIQPTVPLAAPRAASQPNLQETHMGLTTEEVASPSDGLTLALERGAVGSRPELAPTTAVDKLAAPRATSKSAPGSRPRPAEKPPVPVAAIQADRAAFNFLAPPRASDEIGWLGHYRILNLLGVGGMAIVFRAEDSSLHRRVALKVMKPELAAEETFRRRFLREARAMAAIDHDHIVTIFQVGEDQNTPFFAMQLLQGESLEQRLRRQTRLSAAEAMRIGREIAEGLAAAHEHNLIHRDIKPDNVFLETRPAALQAPSRVKILDFGLVRPAGQATQSSRLTRTGLVMGTPVYMSPEQARGQVLDVRSDIFSLGTVLYEACTGIVPFGKGDTMAILTALAVDNPRSPHELNRDVPATLGKLIMSMLAKKREDRPASARDVVAALREIEASLAGAAH